MAPGQQLVEAGATARQRLDVEAECRELMREGLELGLVGTAVGTGHAGDAHRGVAHEAERIGLAEHAERADDLLQRLVQLQQGVALGLVAEEVVEDLLDMREAGQHLLRKLGERSLFLRFAGAGEAVEGAVGVHGFATLQGGEAAQYGVGASADAALGRTALEGGLEQQQAGGDLQCAGVGELQRVAAQPVGEIADAVDEALRGRAAERRRGLAEGADGILEARQGDRGARAELVPVLTGHRELAVERVEQRRDRRVPERGAGLGNQRLELPARLDRGLMLGVGRRGGDLVQQFAQQAIGRRRCAAHQAAKLRVDLGAQAPDRRFGPQPAMRQGIEKGEADPPQAACGGRRLHRLDLGDGVAHGARTVARGAPAQPVEQAALEAAACAPQSVRDVAVGRGRGVGVACRRAARKVGVEQVCRAGVGLPARGSQGQVMRGQAQGLVGRAVRELVQIIADHRQRAAHERTRRSVDRALAAAHRAEQLLERVGELRQAVEADDGQRTAHLVQVGLGELQAGCGIVAVGALQRLAGTREGGVDLALDPDQRPQVRLGGVCHGRVPAASLRP